jgi:transcription elongation factor Elf1
MMTTTNVTQKTSTLTCTTPARGMTLPCPRCGEANASFDLNLADGDTLHCQDCDENFSVEEIRDLVKRWGRMLAWIDSMPSEE